MNSASLEKLIEAVLYEGHVLYPYRPSSKKNRRERFTFGRVYPDAYSKAQEGAEPCVMQTECLVEAALGSPVLNASVRFLHPIERTIGAFETPLAQVALDSRPAFRLVPELRVGERLLQPWLEAGERKVNVPPIALADEPTEAHVPFRFFAWRDRELVLDETKFAVGVILRRQEMLEGAITVVTQPLRPGVWKLTARIGNETPVSDLELEDREAIALRTFASTHTVLNLKGGEFVSLLDTPAHFRDDAVGCKNLGTFPVLVGEESRRERDTMLSSPIILYDYPKIAPESAGTLFDGTEIDEILSLRILTMTDEEKREMRYVDEQARSLLERTESLSSEALLKMHGRLRPEKRREIEFDDFFGPSTRLEGVSVDGIYLQAGDRVRLRPKARADVMDMALKGQTAIIEAVEEDLEKRVHLAVVLENDPGHDLGMLRQPGHRFFYGVDEVEPLSQEVAR